MMRRFLLLVAFLWTWNAYGQKNTPYLGEVLKMINMVKTMNNVRYQYQLRAQFPDETTDQVEGEVYLANDRKFFYNSNDAFTLIYSDSWYYNADHRKKKVEIYNLNKHLTKEYRSSIEKEIFGKDMLNLYLDSVILKYAHVKELKKNGDTVNLQIEFTDKMPLKSCRVVYNETDKDLISYSIRTFQPWKGKEYGKNKGTTKEITCYNFKKAEEGKKYATANFFSVEKGTVVLRKYRKYDLNVKL